MIGLIKSRISDLLVTRTLRLGKNAVIKVTGATGTETEVDLTELNVLDGLTSTTAELNLVDNAPANVTIAYAASSTTDGIEATLTVVNAAGAAVTGIHNLNVWISDDTDGNGLTATAASGALTAATGTILTALTAKKHVIANTSAAGVLKLLLVDSANTAGERFCVANPLTGKIIVGAASVAGNYEGGA
jgi:hypothetical protein